MVILIATEDASTLAALTNLLQAQTSHQVFSCANLHEVERHASAADVLELLLCARHFSTTDGLAVQEAMLSKFPNLHTGFLATELGAAQSTSASTRLFFPATSPAEILLWVQEVAAQNQAEQSAQTPAPQLLDSLLGLTLGDYRILECHGEAEQSQTYLARQISMHRNVILERLKPEFQNNSNAKRQFRALVRAMANVAHPSIATVYEAQETAEGEIFYTRELVQGRSLLELTAPETKLSQDEALELLRVTGEGVHFYGKNAIARRVLQPKDVFLGNDGIPRLANLATIAGAEEPNATTELAGLARGLQGHCKLTAQGRETEIASLLNRMKGQGTMPIPDWPSLVRAVKRTQQHLLNLRASQGGAAPRVSGTEPSHPQPRTLVPMLLAILGLGIVAAAVALLYTSATKAAPRRLSGMVKIPAGPSIPSGGESVNLPEYWIDQYEVTIAQYAEFLNAVGAGVLTYNHPHQPADKANHEPLNWKEYFPAAQENGTYKGHPISLNTPVLWADWWDAYAYAQWRGHRLPTDQEWEKAARGSAQTPYPWGANPEPARANTGEDFSTTSTDGGTIDGFASWCDADAKPQDVSATGVCAMAGNVSEWTSSWVQHPDLPDQQSPVYRGGNFTQKNAPVQAQRWTAKSPDLAQPFLGFRTVSDHPPVP